MNSHYKKIAHNTTTYIYYIEYSFNPGSVAVYLNGLRLFLDVDYVVNDQTVTILFELKSGDLLIISWCS